MDFLSQKTSFDTYIGVKSDPNNHEKYLFLRAQKYIQKITWIPGIRMIAVVNSLSMYATHPDSDIDLFIITAKNRMWIVRVCITFFFWYYGVWRKGEDIAENFCLSFFIEEEESNLSSIAFDDDIYLYFWIYYMKPIYTEWSIYEDFLWANTWVDVPFDIRLENMRYLLPLPIIPSSHFFLTRWILTWVNKVFQCIWGWKARSQFQKKGSPEGVIITSRMLKFHDSDKREEIRDSLDLRDE